MNHSEVQWFAQLGGEAWSRLMAEAARERAGRPGRARVALYLAHCIDLAERIVARGRSRWRLEELRALRARAVLWPLRDAKDGQEPQDPAWQLTGAEMSACLATRTRARAVARGIDAALQGAREHPGRPRDIRQRPPIPRAPQRATATRTKRRAYYERPGWDTAEAIAALDPWRPEEITPDQWDQLDALGTGGGFGLGADICRAVADITGRRLTTAGALRLATERRWTITGELPARWTREILDIQATRHPWKSRDRLLHYIAHTYEIRIHAAEREPIVRALLKSGFSWL